MNAAIFSAAGPSLEVATKERANTLAPGKAAVIPVPADSPLFIREGVTHVIHVVGPNMNPQRPNCLKNNYDEGCKILREAYSSLFEGFVSILKRSEVQNHRGKRGNNASDQKMKREIVHVEERSKKNKGLKYEVGSGNTDLEQQNKSKSNVNSSKAWGSWAQALYSLAMNPEKHKSDVLETTIDVIVLNDIYPKVRTLIYSSLDIDNFFMIMMTSTVFK